MWRSKPKTREELFEEVKYAEHEYDLNTRDSEKLKSWITVLMDAVYDRHSHKRPNLPFLYDAKSKLEKALETGNDDLYTKFELGRVCSFILDLDHDILFNEVYGLVHDQAVKLFEEVQLQVPDLYGDSCLLETLKSTFPDEPPSDCDEVDSEEDIDTEGLASILWYEQSCQDAADNAQNFKNLNRWGAALMGLAYYNRDPAKKLKLTEEAMGKFQAAYELEPQNIHNKRDLAKARLRICCYLKGSDYEELLASYEQLLKEVEEESKKRKRDS